MNKKIYFNAKFLAFDSIGSTQEEQQAVKIYKGSDEKTLQKTIQDFLNVNNSHSIQVLSSDNFDTVLNRLKKTFTYIEAAGGFIERENNFLFIHRHGRWDLPKGKLEKGELIEQAALRECEEECGVKDLSIVRPLPSTFHIYEYKNGYALKQTFWFYMRTTFTGALIPQLEEDIDVATWFSKKEVESEVLKDTYYTISDTIHEALELWPSKI